MAPPIQLRLARDTDASSVAKLSAQLGYAMSTGQAERRLKAAAAREDQAVWVATAGGTQHVVGWIHVFTAAGLLTDPFAEIGGLVVEEAWRGQGIGSLLLAHAITWAQQAGYATMRIRSNVIRERAHGFYRRRGFRWLKSQHVFIAELAADAPD